MSQDRHALDGMLLTPAGWVRGRLHFTAAIAAIEPRADAPADRFILPGFIDLHVHGGAGADCMQGAAALQQMARFHARHGTTAMLATTVTAPKDDLRRAVAAIGAATKSTATGAAQILGVHLEGPFISPHALGAQPPYAIPPNLALVDEWCALAPIRVATIAPEIDPDGALLAHFQRHGVKVQIGHTICAYAQAKAALDAGAAGFTHLFNAMSGLHHREPGAAGCALANARFAEMIFDRLHVADGAAHAALRAIPGLYGITDAVAAAGMPDGEYRLGQHRILKRGATVRLADGTLAGSVLTMDQALRNLLQMGLTLAQAAPRLATIPAEYLNLAERGRIAVGMVADLVVCDAAGALQAVIVQGTEVREAR